jgi:hypothetical protein
MDSNTTMSTTTDSQEIVYLAVECPECARKDAEIARLTEHNRQMVNSAEFFRDKEIESRNAEIARLRDALASVWLHHGQVAPDGCRDCDRRITAALAEPSAEGGAK